MRRLATFTTNGEVSSTIDLKRGQGFIAGWGSDFGPAVIAIQWRTSDSTWTPFVDAKALAADFDYTVCAKTPIVIRAVITGTPNAPITIEGGALLDHSNPRN